MTKITVDKETIEQALDALEMGLRFRTTGVGRPPEQYNPPALTALREALAEPAVEPCVRCTGLKTTCIWGQSAPVKNG